MIKVKAITETRTEEAKQIRKDSMKSGKDFSPRRAKELKVRDDDNANTVTATQGVEQLIVIQKTRGNCTTIKDNETGTLQSGGANVMDKVPNVVVQLNPSTESGGKQPYQQNRVYAKEGLSPTIDQAAGRWNINTENIRRLTETECERLQGYPDSWTKFGLYVAKKSETKKHPTKIIIKDGIAYIVKRISKSQRYKLCGNAVTTNIVELIGSKLLSNVD